MHIHIKAALSVVFSWFDDGNCIFFHVAFPCKQNCTVCAALACPGTSGCQHFAKRSHGLVAQALLSFLRAHREESFCPHCGSDREAGKGKLGAFSGLCGKAGQTQCSSQISPNFPKLMWDCPGLAQALDPGQSSVGGHICCSESAVLSAVLTRGKSCPYFPFSPRVGPTQSSSL